MEQRGNNILSLDSWISRGVDRKRRKPPEVPLTEEEKERLKVNCRKYCESSLVSRCLHSGLMGTDVIGDVVQESYILLCDLLEKFDKKFYKDKIGDEDCDGKTASKTLEFYFENYYSQRVNLIAVECRKQKKLKGIGPRSIPVDISYDEVSEQSFGVFNTEAGQELAKSLEKKSEDLQLFVTQQIFEGFKQDELQEYWGEKYKLLKTEMGKWRKDMQRKLQSVYDSE